MHSSYPIVCVGSYTPKKEKVLLCTRNRKQNLPNPFYLYDDKRRRFNNNHNTITMRTTFLCLAALAELALTAMADPMRIPLYRRTDSGIVTAAGEALDNGVLAGKVYIGNPPQEFTMAFDTNTGYSWVRGSRCKSENCLDRCTYYARRSDSVVSTGEKFSVEYGDACVDTHVYLDTIEFNGIKVENMPFGGAYRMSGFDDGFDGYLGLGRSVDFNKTKIYSSSSGHLAKRADLPSSAFVANAYQSGSVESAQFGMVTNNNGNNGFSQDGASTGGGSTTDSGSTTTNNGQNQQQPGTTTGTGSTTTTGDGQQQQPGTTTGTDGQQQPGTTTGNGQQQPGTTTGNGHQQQPGTTTGNGQQQPGTTTGNGQQQPQQPNSGENVDEDGEDGVDDDDPVYNGGFGFTKRNNNKQPDGYLILGGVDKSLLDGDMEYIPLADVPEGSQKNWDVCIKDANFEYNLNIKQKPNAIASISTANGFITMPSDQADIFQEVFGLKLYHSTNTYGIKCSEVKNLPTLKLTLENHIVELPPKYWIREIDADRDCCATRIRKGDSDRDWVLGTPFTNAFYTSFDPDTESVGLGIIKGHKDDGLRIYQKTIHKKDD
ncbi:hypothetical protein RO3G_03088 [Lichtheimia corymbifera JMRC:FSU:9682]|uniref:Peptidase A1 domain-containing protein n=1 Tax=Lichtheimia corymbifera JMRC:FSU:9682 TaxID=1263082 RepID=A0A068SEB8_9FUNG|nr:hypothetical protein RO3G_03088 [Lichtheimia corymbifera JMRC:FSU:9682]